MTITLHLEELMHALYFTVLREVQWGFLGNMSD